MTKSGSTEHKSVNIEREVYDRFKQYSLVSGACFTDTVNLALKEFLDSRKEWMKKKN